MPSRPRSSPPTPCRSTRASRSSRTSPTRPTALVGIWPLDHEGSVAEYQRLAHAAVDDALAAGAHRRSSSAARASTSALPSPTWSSRRRRRPARASAGSASTTGSGPERRTPLSPSAIRRRRCRPPQRPTARRPRPRAARGGRVARTPARPALERGDPPPDARSSASTSRRPVLEERIRERTRGDVRTRGGERRSHAALAGADLADREPDHRPARDRRAPSRRGDRRDRAPHATIRGLPAQVDAPDSQRSLRFRPTARPRRPRPRSSRGARSLSPQTASLRCRRFAIREMARARQRLSPRRAGRDRRAAGAGARPAALRLPRRGRLGRRPRGARRGGPAGGDRHLEPRRLDGGALRQRDAHRRAVARAP